MTSPASSWPSMPIAFITDTWSWHTLSALDMLFLAAFATLSLTLVLGRWARFAPLFTLGYGLEFWALTQADVLTGDPLDASLGLRVLQQPVLWRYDSLAWFFALLTIGSAFICSLFALALRSRSAVISEATQPLGAGSWHAFHVALALAVLSSLGLFGSANLLALYIGWELAVWSLFLLLATGGAMAVAGASRYAIYSFGGGLALLAALALLLQWTGSLEFAHIRRALPTLDLGQELLLAGLLTTGIGLRLGVLPLLGWTAGIAQLPGPVYWHGVAARIGLFAPLVLLAEIIGIDGLSAPGFSLGIAWPDLRTLLCWVAAALLLVTGWRAWRRESVGAVLGWLALSQTSFILLALLVGGSFGSASGLLLLFSLGLAEAVLAGLCLIAVPLSWPSKRLPLMSGPNLQRLALGAIALAGASVIGLPPTLGFVAKWLLYDALLTDPLLGWSRWPLLMATLVGGFLALLALLRLASLMRVAVPERRGELPYGVMAPILGLSALTVLAGVLPGPAMSWVAAMQQALGIDRLDWSLSGVGGRFDMLWISLGQMLLLTPVMLWWQLRRRTRVVEPDVTED